MKKILLFILILPLFVNAQINDNFSDGNFTISPVWSGDTAKFEVIDSLLHLNAPAVTDTAYLSTNSQSINNAVWEFYVKLAFSPSDNNNARIYLVADQYNLKGPVNGYYIRLGEGGSDDSIDLFRQDGTSSTKIIDGINGHCAVSNNIIRIKVTRDNTGNWELFSDTLGGTDYHLEGTTLDSGYIQNNYFGIFCKYTSSNSDKFYFDDFNVIGNPFVDTIIPYLLNLRVISNTELELQFSENLEQSSAETTDNYNVNSIGTPYLAALDVSEHSTVHLSFLNTFSDGLENTLTIDSVEDINGNLIETTNVNFTYYTVKVFDIVINEIMTDENPSPAVLPEYDYVELFNTTPFPVNLNGWTITFGSTIKTFPDVLIQADSFLILCHENADSLLSQYGQVLGFSSFSVNNESSVSLKNTDGNIIHAISYTTDWYNDENKKSGGWSLEQIDPANPCGCVNNWRASVDPSGGTPGRKNSVYAPNPDNTNPELIRVRVLDSNEIQVYFSETLDTINLKNAGNYTIDNGIGVPNNVILVEPDFNSVILELSSPLQIKTIYTLTITDTITDCVGNIVALNSKAQFAIPETAEPLDIVINEVLSNPKDDGKDFVEIYNRSDKVIDLKELTLSSMDEITSTLTSVKDISGDGFLIFPSEYYVLTTDPDIVKSQYYTSNPDGFIKMESLPVFSNDQGIVVIADKAQNIIDKLTYTEDMQFALLNTTDGVSLERLNFDRPTQDKTNWHSAAESVGFATPAYKNSQWTDTEQTNDEITVYPEIFSPDQDGYNDVLNINYHFEEPGYVANIVIYDSKGRLIKNLVKSELLATNGTISWDGINEDNERSVIGIYIIYVEVFNLNGDVKHYRRTCVLGKKL